MAAISQKGIRMTITVLASLPIFALYPFMQKYFSIRSFDENAAGRECKRIVDKINSKEEKLAEQENRTPMRMYIHPHMFRHTFITRCIQSGLSAETIAKIVGHADIKMTHYYTHIEDDFMKKEYTKFTKIYTEERGN